MSNLQINNSNKLRLIEDDNEYWDFYLAQESAYISSNSSYSLSTDCLVSYIDIANLNCVINDGDWICSDQNYTYSKAFSSGSVLNNIGLTGVDNGYPSFKKDRITNQEFYDIFTNSKMNLAKDDLRLKLHKVDGSSQDYQYPIDYNMQNKSITLNGGFYQGFFQDVYGNYSVLPSVLNNDDVWTLSFVLKPEDLAPINNIYKRLNDSNFNNKGIFFYMGTRAENKWIYLYNKDYKENEIDNSGYIINNFFNINDTLDKEVNQDFVTELQDKFNQKDPELFDNIADCYDKDTFDVEEIKSCLCGNEDSDYIADEVDISNENYQTDNGFDTSSPNDFYFTSNNKFLTYDNTEQGLKAGDDSIDTEFIYVGKKEKFNGNLFLLMNQTPSGYTTNNIDGVIDTANLNYDTFYKDVYNNAFALRITEDGAVGYRMLIEDCESSIEGKYSIIEDYSQPNIVSKNEWCSIDIKFFGGESTMKLYFYVNGDLKYVTKDLPKFNFRKLDELNEKQEGVPYNISIGGGTQGLAETVILNYMLPHTIKYPIENFFAGSFIGELKSFKFYCCDKEKLDLEK